MMFRPLAALAAAAALTLSAAPAVAASHPTGLSGKVLSSQAIGIGSAPYPAGTHAYRMRYLSATPRDGYTVVTGLTLVPPGRPPAGGWPVIAWDHGTTGIGDGCAPSAVPGAYYGPTLATFLRHGYAVTATDYPGLGTPGIHPYLITRSEALATIDSVRAGRQVAAGLSRQWFAVGHSQGGQASWATAELADRYGAGLRFRGAVAYAPAPNMSGYVEDIASADPLDQEFYSMMLVGLTTQYPRLRYADYLGPRARAMLPDVRARCFDDLTGRFAAARLPATEFEPKSAAARRLLRKLFAANEIGHRRSAGPLLVLQGAADPVVARSGTDAEVADARRHGSRVDYHVYPGTDHGGVLPAADPDVLAWLAAQWSRK